MTVRPIPILKLSKEPLFSLKLLVLQYHRLLVNSFQLREQLKDLTAALYLKEAELQCCHAQ